MNDLQCGIDYHPYNENNGTYNIIIMISNIAL